MSEKSEDEEKSEKSEDEEEEGPTVQEEEEEKKPAKDKDDSSYEELEAPPEGYEWASDVDSKGKVIWGEEGVDYEWYYKEDKEAFEKGQYSTIPELLNHKQISDNKMSYWELQDSRDKIFTGVKAQYAKDNGAIYRVKAKKRMNQTMGPGESNKPWKN